MSNANIACPEEILASIPWYPDGLTADECGAVEAHAADCRACRAELAFVRGDEEPAIELPDAERVYARVLDRISSDDRQSQSSQRRMRMGRAARKVSAAICSTASPTHAPFTNPCRSRAGCSSAASKIARTRAKRSGVTVPAPLPVAGFDGWAVMPSTPSAAVVCPKR